MRYLALIAFVVATVGFGYLTLGMPRYFGLFFLISVAFLGMGLHDFFQREHALLRNYPLLAHFRWMIEAIRPEIRQYLLESDTEAAPFSREHRSQVYQRAKNVNDADPFGTEHNVYAEGTNGWCIRSPRKPPAKRRRGCASAGRNAPSPMKPPRLIFPR